MSTNTWIGCFASLLLLCDFGDCVATFTIACFSKILWFASSNVAIIHLNECTCFFVGGIEIWIDSDGIRQWDGNYFSAAFWRKRKICRQSEVYWNETGRDERMWTSERCRVEGVKTKERGGKRRMESKNVKMKRSSRRNAVLSNFNGRISIRQMWSEGKKPQERGSRMNGCSSEKRSIQ